MPSLIDLTGKECGQLTVISRHPSPGSAKYWLCRCKCGSEVIRRHESLRYGRTSSCGCKKGVANAGQYKRQDGKLYTEYPREYGIWTTMKQRMLNPKAHAYERYGGAGLSLEPRWISSFEEFINDVGPSPSQSHSLDRIDPSAGYFQGNVRWADPTVQNTNRSTVRFIDYEGCPMKFPDWCRKMGVPADHKTRKRVYMRIYRYGWTPEQALILT